MQNQLSWKNLPDYITKSTPRPASARRPWYLNTAPTYAGVFLWIGFYEAIASDTLDHAGLPMALLALCVAAALCVGLYYYGSAMFGLKTGLPLYVIGSSTFGARGGYLIPGLLMGALQVGWYGVSTDLATKFLLKGFGASGESGTLAYTLVAVLWGYAIAWIAAAGIAYVSRVSLFVSAVPLIVILVVFFKTQPGFETYVPAEPNTFLGFTLLIQIVTGFFATAGAAGADFGMESRNTRDVRLGGIVGIGLAILYAGGLTLVAMAGAHSRHPEVTSYNFDALIGIVGGPIASAMFLLYAIASVPGACFCAFIMGNSFSTMLPNLRRTSVIFAGVTLAIIMAATGVASHLEPFFQIIGASFGPVCGAILADYLLSGKKWAGPREGINWAGYAAWLVGFVVGIIPFLPVSETFKTYSQPAAVYSAVTGFAVYWVLAKAGLQSKALEAKILVTEPQT
jgi:cytosine permease